MEDGACCDRVSLKFGVGGGERSCGLFNLLPVETTIIFEPCAGRCIHNTVLTTGLVAISHFFVASQACLRASVVFFAQLLARADCCCGVLWS